jgi:hypothetical protein
MLYTSDITQDFGSRCYRYRLGYMIPSSQNGHWHDRGSASGPPSKASPQEQHLKIQPFMTTNSIGLPHEPHRSDSRDWVSSEVWQFGQP